jgi:2-methylisocitrate lyase-like PEP mutase family enzyme
MGCRLGPQPGDAPARHSVDIETGPVGAAVAAGAVGVNMEDAMGPAAAHAALVRSVKREVPHLFVNARADTHWQRPGDLTETLRRIRHYADAGADSVLVPGLAQARNSSSGCAVVIGVGRTSGRTRRR